jgi:hypothetical protein
VGLQSGISSAVLLSATLGELLALQEEELSAVDPLVANLAVAKGVPSLGHLDIMRYQKIVNEWTADLSKQGNWTPKSLPPLPSTQKVVLQVLARNCGTHGRLSREGMCQKPLLMGRQMTGYSIGTFGR